MDRLAVGMFGPARHEGHTLALPLGESAQKVLEQDELVGGLQAFACGDAGFEEAAADLLMHLGKIDAQRLAHGGDRLVPFGLLHLIEHEIVAAVLGRGLEVAIALFARAFRRFVEQGIFQLHPVAEIESGLVDARQHAFQQRARAEFGGRAGIIGENQHVVARLRPGQAARRRGIDHQRIVVEIGAAVGDAGNGQDDVGRVERQRHRRHAHAVFGDALEAAGRDHLPAQKAVGIRHRHRGEAAFRIGQIFINCHGSTC